MNSEHVSLAAAAAVAAVTGVCGLPSYRTLVRRLVMSKTSYQPLDQLYEDEDGKATIETQRAYSTIFPRTIALLAVALGSGAAVAQAVLATVGIIPASHPVSVWLRLAAWLLLSLQGLAVFLEPQPQRRFILGAQGFVAALTVFIGTVSEVAQAGQPWHTRNVRTTLLLVQAGLALLAGLSWVCIQRRPVVFSNGRIVDGERTTSMVGRLSYSWCSYLIDRAARLRQLEYADLPQLAWHRRAEYLQQRFKQSKQYSRLWKTIMAAFRWQIFAQLSLVSLKSVTMFVPQYAMYKILEILESPHIHYAIGIWAWVAILGGVMLFQAVLENWLFWIVWTELGIPLRNMLSTIIFQKTMRRKDVKGPGKKKEPAHDLSAESQPVINPDAGSAAQSTAIAAGNVGSTENIDPSEEEMDQKSRQTTINLVGVDSNRVAMFVSYAYFYPGTIVQIVISVVFLSKIIGWPSLLAGLACFSVSIPLNIWASRNYSRLSGQLMDVRDKKLAVTNEALQGIRQIKFSALEKQWQAKINDYREQEIQTQWKAYLFDTLIIGCYICSPILLSAGCLGTYSALYGDLSPSTAFTTISVLSALEGALSVIPELTTEGIDAWISANRINDYLDTPELVDSIEPAETITFDHADIAWPAESQEEDPDRFVLRDVDFTIPAKELTLISGKTGAGKSLLLASLLGEIDKLSGNIYAPKVPSRAERFDAKATKGNWIIDSAIAFVAQVPWIENASVKDNILFGLPLDEGRYQATLRACALVKDLDMLDDGDLTEIGHNGVNLSGGQRWRVSFARALYSRAGILVLDDVFSAVDAHVGRQLFEEALTGDLAVGRTRILVTHHVSLVLPKVKYAIHLADGTVQYAGFVEDLRRDGRIADLLATDVPAESSSEETLSAEETEVDGLELAKVMSRRSQRSAIIDDGGKGKQDTPRKFVEDEKRETGAIKAAVYKKYLKSSGGFWLWAAIASCFAIVQGFDVLRGWWVAVWTDSYRTEAQDEPLFFYAANTLQHPTKILANLTAPVAPAYPENDTTFYLMIYLVLSVGSGVIGTLKYLNCYVASIRASRLLFDQLAFTILRAPLRWLDTVPVGRILNRFTADFNIIDSNLAPHLGFVTYKITETIGITVVSFFASPYMVPLAFLLLGVALYVAMRYLTAARSVKRLENNAKSPIFELFGSVLIGIATVRGYSKAEEYIERMWMRIDEHGRSYFDLWLTNRWMGFRLSLVGAFFSICVAVIIAISTIPASLAGFALAFALQYSDAVIWVLRAYSALELDMTACERVMEFSSLETESQGGVEPPAAWPTRGEVDVEDLVCSYAPDLPPVLKGLTFSVASGQRVGVVGRTGAGKSSLTLALFRFLEAREGRVLVDGIDISTLTLQALRSRLAIIPQDPVLFSGTVRSNLDPFEQHDDAALRDALERVHLVPAGSTSPRPGSGAATPEANTNIFRSLHSRISEGGLNLSQGQRQLLCLARAIVARPRVMVLDEATSAVDKETDGLIQRSIRAEFAGSTLIVIAHRLSTIADFDRILVLGEGRVVEFGPPSELLAKEGGQFRDMVEQSGEREVLESLIRGEQQS